MKNKKIFLIISAVALSFLLIGAIDSIYFKINKSFEIFGALFREISANYVEEIAPEDLMKDGIEGILDNLDPYTVYLDETDTEDIDFVTSGAYTGLGITVSVYDDMMTVTEVQDGFSAHRAGLRVGDRLYKIDSNIVLNLPSDELRKYTRKPPGTEINLWVLRDGLDDTLYFRLDIEEITLKNVTYSGILDNDIGYIKLERFTRTSSQEVTEAINYLNRIRHLKGIILDLRDNPGGLLDAAVSICELFVPKGSLIVTTKGRKVSRERKYRSLLPPMEPDLPLAVIINGSSASASEIVSGALQDMDRAVIVGKKSFGKGLVQSIYDLPYNTAVKVTTAKYYIPSGRCIQKINYGKKNVEESKYFYTKNGRKVDESIGIIPDTIVTEKEYPYFVKNLLYSGFIFKYANIYTSKLDKLPDKFDINNKILTDFNDFINQKENFNDTPIISRINELADLVEQEKLNSNIKDKLLDIKAEVVKGEKNLVMIQKNELSEFLKDEILRRFKSQKEMLEYQLNKDEYVKTAVGVLSPGLYNTILAGSDSLNLNKN
jgi:carboxyl-terminal processing protease